MDSLENVKKLRMQRRLSEMRLMLRRLQRTDMIYKGKMSTFGGSWDKTDPRFNDPTQGLTLYEHWEADLRPDLFMPRPIDKTIGTFKRLLTGSLYFACPFIDPINRREIQMANFKAWHPDRPEMAVRVSLVDRGPATDTGRLFDISEGLSTILGLDTNDLICFDLGPSKIDTTNQIES